MTTRRAFIPALALAATLVAPLAGARQNAAPNPPAPSTLNVSAIGSIDVAANEVQIVFSVVSQAEAAPAALKDNNDRIASVLAALKTLGLDENETSTSNFRISPRYAYDPQTGSYGESGRMIGYTVENAVRVKTKKIARAGEIIQTAVANGADQVRGVAFGLSDPLSRRPDAIKDAIRLATLDAEGTAGAAGMRLVRIRNIYVNQPDRSGGGGIFVDRSMSMDASGPSLSPSTIPVTATVNIEYEIAPSDAKR